MEKQFFDLEDIVVWQGAITTYGVICHLINKNDIDIRKADKDEISRYKKRPEN